MSSSPRICVVGSANVDLTFRTPRLPTPGETIAGHAFHLGMGGKGANQAVAAARLGAEVALIARVGNDTFGQEAIRRYRAEGLDVSFVRQDTQCSTGTAAIVVDDAAENCIIVVAGANGNLSQDDVRAASAVIQDADVLLCQLETPLAAAFEAFRLARAAGVLTVLTPAPVMSLPDSLLHLCDICVPNRTELALLSGRKIDSLGDTQSAANMLRERGVKTLVVTLGSQGALLLNADGATHVPAEEVAAVDPTGAGDGFSAALAVWLAQGFSLREAAQQASIVGALTATRLGTQTAFPTLAEVKEYRERSPGVARPTTRP